MSIAVKAGLHELCMVHENITASTDSKINLAVLFQQQLFTFIDTDMSCLRMLRRDVRNNTDSSNFFSSLKKAN